MPSTRKQNIICPICNVLSSLVFSREKYTFYSCPNCTLVFLNPSQISINSKSQYLNDVTSPSKYYEQIQKYDQESFMDRLKIIEMYKKPSALFDIGASIGTFLKTAEQRKWQVTGIEPNPNSVKFGKKVYKIKMIEGFFNISFAENHKKKYDLIYSSDVIEHLKNPFEILNSAKKIAKENGIIVTITPDFDSLLTRLFQIKPLEHLHYFNKKSLEILNQKAGLEILYIGNIHRQRSIQAMLSSTTFEDRKFWRILIIIINYLKIYFLIELLLSLFKEDVMVISIKASSET